MCHDTSDFVQEEVGDVGEVRLKEFQLLVLKATQPVNRELEVEP